MAGVVVKVMFWDEPPFHDVEAWGMLMLTVGAVQRMVKLLALVTTAEFPDASVTVSRILASWLSMSGMLAADQASLPTPFVLLNAVIFVAAQVVPPSVLCSAVTVTVLTAGRASVAFQIML